MSKTIIVFGFGPGISKAVATKFGREGYTVAIVARSADKLAAGVKELAAAGIKAEAFTVDVANPAHVTDVIGKVRASLGPIAAVHWNAYGAGAGDATTAPLTELANQVTIATVSLTAAVQASLGDLKATKGAVLVTNGGLGYMDQSITDTAAKFGLMGLSVANAAKHKLVALLAAKLTPDVYVGEVVVTQSVKGTSFDNGSATLEPSLVADRFWVLSQERKEVSVRV